MMKLGKPHYLYLLILTGFLFGVKTSIARDSAPVYSKYIYPGPDGKLSYAPVNKKGDRIIDFSCPGYRRGGVRIPDVPAKMILEPVKDRGGNSERIWKAIDAIAAMPSDSNRFGGAVLLKKGK